MQMTKDEVNRKVTELLGGCCHEPDEFYMTIGTNNFVCKFCKEDYKDNKDYYGNIADAWELVVFLRKDGWYVSVVTAHNGDVRVCYQKFENNHVDIKEYAIIDEKTAPEAISKAFIEVMDGLSKEGKRETTTRSCRRRTP